MRTRMMRRAYAVDMRVVVVFTFCFATRAALERGEMAPDAFFSRT